MGLFGGGGRERWPPRVLQNIFLGSPRSKSSRREVPPDQTGFLSVVGVHLFFAARGKGGGNIFFLHIASLCIIVYNYARPFSKIVSSNFFPLLYSNIIQFIVVFFKLTNKNISR